MAEYYSSSSKMKKRLNELETQQKCQTEEDLISAQWSFGNKTPTVPALVSVKPEVSGSHSEM